MSLPTHPIWFDADPTRLEQVLVNLLDNASKFSGCGDHIWLAAEVEQEAEWITLRVRDEGAGIPADLLPHLFEVFSQADRSLDRSAGGLGVGLALVKAIVNLHAGTVSAYSAGPGQGSEFVVRLPVRTGVRRSAPDPREVVRTAGSSQRILVVEDIRDAAETLQELLHEMGHDVRIALHGSTALVLAQEFRPEVVLLDIGLPGMDGYEVARRLRLAGMADAVMIALTGYGMEEDRRRTREAGFQHHLTKPVDPAELQQLLSSTATELRAQPAAG